MGDDDGEVLTGTTDKLEPWTIKVFSRNTRNMVVAAARDEGVTTGQWLERCIRDRMEGGGSSAVQGQGARASVSDLAQLMQEARAMAAAAGVAVPAGMARDAFALVRQATRQARGVQPRQRALPRP